MDTEKLEKCNDLQWKLRNLEKIKRKLQSEDLAKWLNIHNMFFGEYALPDDDPILVEITTKVNDAFARSTEQIDARIDLLQAEFNSL